MVLLKSQYKKDINMYELFVENIGQRFNVVNGEFVKQDDGPLIVSLSPIQNSIYINKFQEMWVVRSDQMIGTAYNFGRNDCAILCARYLDKHVGSNIEEKLLALTFREWANYARIGVENIIKDVGGYEVDISELQPNDVVSYLIPDSDVTSHLAVYLGNEKILHHVPKKYSSIDDFDETRVTKVFRYGN
jgi:hypothetical protein